MTDFASRWEDHWNTFPNKFGRQEFLRQVGKTFGGQPISVEQVNLLIDDVVQKLELKSHNQVLDLCCGNGLLTFAIAEKCQQVIGVDYAPWLIEIARQYHSAPNARYYCQSVMDINLENLQQAVPFTKIYMYEALQNFEEAQIGLLLEKLMTVSSKDMVILLASIPQYCKMSKFYNTPEFQSEYRKTKRANSLGLGIWWKQSVIRKACQAKKLRCEFLPQPRQLHTAHYRFDVRITRR